MDELSPRLTTGSKAAFSIEEFCQRFGIGRSMVYLENKKGRLPFRKVGTRTLILTTDAETWASTLPEVTPCTG